MWLDIHLTAFIILFILAVVKLVNSERPMKWVVMFMRVMYLVLIGTGIRLIGFTYQDDLVMTIVKVGLALTTISFCEFAISPRGNRKFHFMMVGLILLTALTGFMLADWAPFV